MTVQPVDLEVEAVAEGPGPPAGAASAIPMPMAFLPHLLAGLAGILVALVPDHRLALRGLFVVSCAYALYLVGSRGRAYLTPSGVYFLSSGVFIGVAAYYLAAVGSVNDLGALRDWAVVAFATTVATGVVVTALTIRWRITWPARAQLLASERLAAPRSPVNFQIRALLLVGVSQLPVLKDVVGAAATAIGLAGVMMLVLAASSRRVRMRWHGDAILVGLAVVVPFVWIQLEFEGGGRLTLAGLGVASLLAWNLVRPRRLQKVMVVLAIPAFLVFSGLNRLEKDGDRNAESKSVLSSGEGLESMYAPLDTWAELVLIDPDVQKSIRGEAVGPRYGKTFLNTLTLPIPRSWWEKKPKGFGAELTEVLRPVLLREERISKEHSMAALIQGEFYVNFGLRGLALLPFVLGAFLAVLDRAHARLAAAGLRRPDDWWRATILVCLVASLGDLCWVGTFTFFARGGLAAIVAWGVWRFSTRRERRPAHGDPEPAPAAEAWWAARRTPGRPRPPGPISPC